MARKTVEHLQDTGHSWLEQPDVAVAYVPGDAANQYPKRKFHGLDESKVIHTPEEEKELGFGWHDSPVDAREAHAKIHDKGDAKKADELKSAEAKKADELKAAEAKKAADLKK